MQPSLELRHHVSTEVGVTDGDRVLNCPDARVMNKSTIVHLDIIEAYILIRTCHQFLLVPSSIVSWKSRKNDDKRKRKATQANQKESQHGFKTHRINTKRHKSSLRSLHHRQRHNRPKPRPWSPKPQHPRHNLRKGLRTQGHRRRNRLLRHNRRMYGRPRPTNLRRVKQNRIRGKSAHEVG